MNINDTEHIENEYIARRLTFPDEFDTSSFCSTN